MKYPPSSLYCCHCNQHLCIYPMRPLCLIMLMFSRGEVYRNDVLEHRCSVPDSLLE